MKAIPISIAEVELVAFELAKALLKYDEPIPDFSSRFPNILESCLAAPFQEFGDKYLYEGLVRKTAVLFYLMINSWRHFCCRVTKSNHCLAYSNSRATGTTK